MFTELENDAFSIDKIISPAKSLFVLPNNNKQNYQPSFYHLSCITFHV